MAVAMQMDIFFAAQASGTFVRNITSLLSQHDIHLQAVFAFEAIGTLLHAPALTVDNAILVLGGAEDVRVANFKALWGWKRGDISAYLRKSSACVRSFLLFAALKGQGYAMEQAADVLCQMLASSGLGEKFPVAAKQLIKLLKVLEPRTRVFLEDVASASMMVLSMVAAIPDDEQDDLLAASLQLPASTMGNLLVHAFEALKADHKIVSCNMVELRGSVGLFDVATILLWLAPDKIAISLRGNEAHPAYRQMEYGDAEKQLLIQSGSYSFECDDRGNPTSGWKKIPWSSPKALALSALNWAVIAKPLVSGNAGILGGVVITAARKWIG